MPILADSYGFQIDPGAVVEDLSVGEEQRVEILKALYRGVDILILDEPTAVLTPAETQELFGNLRSLRADGKTIVFISHKLDEVLQIADRITVLRRGVVVGETTPAETNKAKLAEMMVGDRCCSGSRSPGARWGSRCSGSTTCEAGRLKGLTSRCARVRSSGSPASRATANASSPTPIMGLRPLDDGLDLARRPRPAALSDRGDPERGIAFVPEDRHEQGSCST